MKNTTKTFLLAIAMLFTCSAWAKWTEVYKDSRSGFYIDTATIRKDGSMRKVWIMNNVLLGDNAGELSRRTKNEFDCKGERMRFLAVSSYSGNMGAGKVLVDSQINQPQWMEIPPNSAFLDVLKVVCAK